MVPTMMMAGMASRKQPTTRNTNTMKKPTPIEKAPCPPRYAQPLRDLVIGEQPAEYRRGANAEECDGGELAGLEKRRPELLASHFAVDA